MKSLGLECQPSSLQTFSQTHLKLSCRLTSNFVTHSPQTFSQTHLKLCLGLASNFFADSPQTLLHTHLKLSHRFTSNFVIYSPQTFSQTHLKLSRGWGNASATELTMRVCPQAGIRDGSGGICSINLDWPYCFLQVIDTKTGQEVDEDTEAAEEWVDEYEKFRSTEADDWIKELTSAAHEQKVFSHMIGMFPEWLHDDRMKTV